MSVPVIIYQMWKLTDSYLKYETEVSVEWIPYRDSENILKSESIPAITVCFEHIFERILFDRKLKPGLENNLFVDYFYYDGENHLENIDFAIKTNNTYISNI